MSRLREPVTSPLGAAPVLLALVLSLLVFPARAASDSPSAQRERALSLVAEVEVLVGTNTFSASAVVVGHRDDGLYLVTADQAVRSADRIRVSFRFRAGAWHEADRVELRGAGQGLAVLRVPGSPALAAAAGGLDLQRLGDHRKVEEGDPVRLAGFSGGRVRVVGDEATVEALRGADILVAGSCGRGLAGGALLDERWGIQGMILRQRGSTCEAVSMTAIQRALRTERQVPFTLQELPPDTVMDIWVDTKILDKKDGQIVVTVLPFENSADVGIGDLPEVAQEVFNELLEGIPGVRVVIRDRLEDILGEYKIALAGLTQDDGMSSQLGQILGGDYLVTGSVVRYEVDRRRFEGYGFVGIKDLYRLGVILQLVDLKSAELRFSESFDAEHTETYRRESSAPATPVDVNQDLLREVSTQAREKLSLELLGRSLDDEVPRAEPIQVAVKSHPSGADVEVDGRYRGSTPLVLPLFPGQSKIAIERAGYSRWEKWVEVEEGIEVDVHLVPR